MVFKRCSGSILLFIFLMLPQLARSESSVQAVKDGNRLYKQGSFDDAVKFYSDALKKGGQDHVANYNLGNALYRKGMAQEKQNIDGAIKDLEEAVTRYEQVLKTDAKDSDAQYNKDFVSRKLEELKKKKQEQEQKQQQKQEQKKDQKQDQQKNEQQNKNEQQEQQQKDQQQKEQEQKQQDKAKEEQKKQDEQKKKEEQSKVEQKPNKKDENKQGQEQQAVMPGEMSDKEAKELLEDYQRNEEPKGLLNFIPKKTDEQPVGKDW
jgi:Ca-activated chloride channel homolog